jgi:hypothetical protein
MMLLTLSLEQFKRGKTFGHGRAAPPVGHKSSTSKRLDISVVDKYITIIHRQNGTATIDR